MTTPTNITVTETLDPHGIGDASGCDAEWQAIVCEAIRSEIESDLSSRYADAEISVSVTMAERGQLPARRVETDGDSDQIRYEVQSAGERGFDRACG